MRHARARRREAIGQAGADMKCTACGRVFEGGAAAAVHADYGTCLPDGAHGQLVHLPDGRWAERWRHPEVR